MRRLARAAPLLLLAGPARAHDLPQTFVEGLLFLPGVLVLPLLSAGLMVAVAGRARLLPSAALAVPLGLAAAPLLGLNADLLALGGGLACALLAASGLPLARRGHGVLALATALLAGAAATYGAGWRAMEPPALLALALAAALLLALPLAIRWTLARWPGPVRLALRVAGAWLAAISALALALTFAGPLP
ncbi:hypothetical protein [Rubellimicrobium aerolatum]|uniref:HupE/UreJ family protein n=1 Tax=Rubellimicrobium aerolatum TaxID=490979 RepID=A0ABW0SFZ3_9RHOB|nr:hypothetical protein [Rubellimicrobium aerolatum]MBP1807228.1 hypothetical protein [Rubellimicrobium aerolatum]